MTWKQLTERDRREWKLSAIDPHDRDTWRSGPKVIKLFSCSTQMSMKFSPLIYVKMPTIVGILTCMSGKNSILGLSEPKKC